LVVLGIKEVIAPLRGDLLTDVSLAEDRIPQDDAALDRQDAQQFQSGFVLVGLPIDFDLDQDGLHERSIGGDQMLAGHRAVAAASQCLAIQRDGLFLLRGLFLLNGIAGSRGRGPRRNPACQGGLEGDRVKAAKKPREARGGGRLAAEKPESVGKRGAIVTTELGDGHRPLAATQHSQHDKSQDSGQGVPQAVSASRVRNLGKHFEQGKSSHDGPP
jgi:hypothetical protein